MRCSVLLSLSMLTLSACAAAPAPATEMRVLVQLAAPLGDAARIAETASLSSGHRVSYVAPGGAGWHALTLSCREAADCEAALQRLQADRSRFLSVQRDERKRIVTP